MFNETVFVIGAGASNEANLPTGIELKRTISRKLDISFDIFVQQSGDKLIVEALRKLSSTNDEINSYLNEARHISEALPQAISIDNFLDSQRGNEKIKICGKLAIVRTILEAERGSKLFFDRADRIPDINLSVLEGTWYLPFFQLITENCELKDLEERFQTINLIIFNYDRCIEHFLFLALQKYYRVPENQAADLVSSIEIFHPYGSVGSLRWCPKQEIIDFGSVPNSDQLVSLISQIKTFTEGTDPDSSDIVAIKERMLDTDRLVFLGFAFHKLNMALISPLDLVPPTEIDYEIEFPPNCYASTFNISESDKEVIRNQINELFDTQISTHMANLECNDFFSEFWRSLSF